MRTFSILVLTATLLAACGEPETSGEPATPEPAGKLRVEYYEISKQ